MAMIERAAPSDALHGLGGDTPPENGTDLISLERRVQRLEDAMAVKEALFSFFADAASRVAAGEVRGSLGADPIGLAARTSSTHRVPGTRG